MEFSQIKAAVFDLDGTLFDSMGVWTEVDKTFLARRNLPLTPDYHQAVKNMNFPEAARYTAKRYHLSDPPEALAREWEEMVTESYRNDVPLKPCAKELLFSLHEKGVKLGVATSSRESLYSHVFARCGIERLFSAIVTTQSTAPKSRPDVYLECAKRLGHAPCECAVFEDILVGARSAKKAGFFVVGVHDETSEAEKEALSRLCDRYIHSFAELL